MTEHLRQYLARHGFGVCKRLTARMAIRTNSMRVFMIYSAFLPSGPPLCCIWHWLSA